MNDLISRAALLAELDKFINPYPTDDTAQFLCGISTAISCIEDAPTVETLLMMNELDRLRAENAKLHEVMELAFEDLQLFDICDYCLNRNTKEDCDRKCEKCQDVCFCINCTHGTRWQWQHADKLNEIKTINTTKQL